MVDRQVGSAVDRWHEVEMMDYHTEMIVTELDPAQVFEIAASMMPDLEWRRGESEAQGARTVSGRHRHGAKVTFWFESDAPGQIAAVISLRGARLDADGSDAWQQPLMDRLRLEVFPAIQADPSSGRPVDDRYWEVIPTALGREQLFELVSTLMPELSWRRGESEGDGSRTVSGWNGEGAMVTFRFESGRFRETTLSASFDGAAPGTDGPPGSRQALEDRLFGEVLPAIRDHRRPGLAPGVSIVWDLQRVVMPDGGEDNVTVSESGDDLAMRVEYTISGGEPAELTIVFHRAAFHLSTPFPGQSPLRGRYSIVGLDVGELADLGATPFLSEWLDDPANRGRLPEGEAHHYFVMFWDAGSAHHIIASSFEVQSAG